MNVNYINYIYAVLLRKKGLSQTLTIKGGENNFSSTAISDDQQETSWDTPLTPEPTDRILGKRRSQQRVRIPTRVSSPRSLSVVPV